MSYEQKLFLLLMLLVIIPCILLAAFAMQALFGQKVLIEQKIKESYLVLAQGTHRSILDRVKAKEKMVASAVNKYSWSERYPSVPRLMNLVKEDPFFQFVYILDQDHNIIYPQDRSQYIVTEKVMIPENYGIFENAYQYEFQKLDFNAAIEEYQKVVEREEQKLEALGYALLAIARCHWKADHMDRALETYQYFITIFNNRSDLQSVTFLIYAKNQIAEIYKTQTNRVVYYESLLDLLEFLIETENRLVKAQYLYHHREVTSRLAHLDQDQSVSEEQRQTLLQKRLKIFQRQEQISRDEDAVRTAKRYILPVLKLVGKRTRQSAGYLDYRIGSQQFLAYYQALSNDESNFNGYVVYMIDLSYCINDIVIPILQSQGGKDIFLTLVDRMNQSVIGEVPKEFFLVASQPLTSFFPFWSVAVYLKNIRSLDELSRYRSQIYLSGLVVVILILLIGVYSTIATFIHEVKSARLKSDFLSNVTHELKTPLTAIKMFVETLLMGRAMSEDEQKECLQIISAEANRLQRLIERILNFAKMEQRKRPFHFSLVDIEKLVQETVYHFKNQISEQEPVQIEVNIEPDLQKILLDAEAIGEALTNLLSNAFKYCDKPVRQIEVNCKKRDSDCLVISVKDNGIGIPKHEFQRIFQHFYRIENPMGKHIEGTGLGLSLVDLIVKAHKGKIELQSKLNVGSEFTILLNYHQLENLKIT